MRFSIKNYSFSTLIVNSQSVKMVYENGLHVPEGDLRYNLPTNTTEEIAHVITRTLQKNRCAA